MFPESHFVMADQTGYKGDLTYFFELINTIENKELKKMFISGQSQNWGLFINSTQLSIPTFNHT